MRAITQGVLPWLACGLLAPLALAKSNLSFESIMLDAAMTLAAEADRPSAAPPTPPAQSQVVVSEDLINASVEIELSNGDTLRGRLVEIESSTIVLDHPALGRITLERNAFVRVYRPRPGQPEASVLPEHQPETEPSPKAPPKPGDKPGPDVPVTPPPAKAPEPPKAKWTSSVRFGLNGSRGAGDVDNARLTLAARRTTPSEALDTSLEYRAGRRNGDRTENRLNLRARNDWLRTTSPWTAFVRGEAEFNELREYDARVNSGAGIGYRLIDKEATKLSADLGIGAIKEFGSPNDEIAPEAIMRLSLQHKLSKLQDIEISGELFPNLRDRGAYRAVTRAVWNIKLSEGGNVSLRFGVTDRYDSQRVRDLNEFDYFTELQWAF
ncbi:MAG: DUF481 domain-containing protein [Phycisphaerales bacterium]|nr:DUF481 domain-containing protein [Phycisphaerales bacterium]